MPDEPEAKRQRTEFVLQAEDLFLQEHSGPSMVRLLPKLTLSSLRCQAFGWATDDWRGTGMLGGSAQVAWTIWQLVGGGANRLKAVHEQLHLAASVRAFKFMGGLGLA